MLILRYITRPNQEPPGDFEETAALAHGRCSKNSPVLRKSSINTHPTLLDKQKAYTFSRQKAQPIR